MTLVFFLLFSCPTPVIAKSIEHFETREVGKLPVDFRTWPLERNKAREVYKVIQEGENRFLRAKDDQNFSVQILRSFDWDIKKYPKLSWRWRAQTLPKNARESQDNLNDSACGVYVIIERFHGHALKYVWSSSLPVGDVVTRSEGKLKIKVLDSGPEKRGSWQEHTVDVLKDYQELFGTPLKKDPTGIALLTDGNATQTPAACDYDDFSVN